MRAAFRASRDGTCRLARRRMSRRREYGAVILVPFREDGTGRARQLDVLLDALDALEGVPRRPMLVVVAEQADDGEKFNRGAMLNAAFTIARAHYVDDRESGEGAVYVCHDVDMAPHASCGAHYGESETLRSAADAGVATVLEARGCRYASDGCFGGVTVYNARAYIASNGYPNTFWGWGGEDHAQFTCCVRAGVEIRRVRDAEFNDLEVGVDDVAAKLASLDAANARIGARDKAKLLRENLRSWAVEGLNSCAFDEPSTRETLRDNERMFAVKCVVQLRCGLPNHARCVTCAQERPLEAFSSRVRGFINFNGRSPYAHGEYSCRACNASKPKQREALDNIKRSESDPTRLTCARCVATFSSRTKLFRHLETCSDGEAKVDAEKE